MPFSRDQIEHDAGVDLARPRSHRQAVERGEAHRALDALPPASAHIEAPLPRWATITRPVGDFGRDFAAGAGDVFVGQAVKSVAADALGIEVLAESRSDRRSAPWPR